MSHTSNLIWGVLLLGLRAVPVDAQSAGLMSGPHEQVLAIPAVSKEIKLTPAQSAEFSKLRLELNRVRTGRAKLLNERLKAAADPDTPFPTPPDRRNPAQIQLMEEESREWAATYATYQAKIRKLLQPEQARRLREIAIQRSGPSAFNDDEVIRALNIDDDKRREIAEIVRGRSDAMRSEVGRLMSDPALGLTTTPNGILTPESAARLRERAEQDPELKKRLDQVKTKGFSIMEKSREDTIARVLKVITKRQRETYLKLRGEPFSFQAASGEASAPSTPVSPKPAPDQPRPKSLSEKRGTTAKDMN